MFSDSDIAGATHRQSLAPLALRMVRPYQPCGQCDGRWLSSSSGSALLFAWWRGQLGVA